VFRREGCWGRRRGESYGGLVGRVKERDHLCRCVGWSTVWRLSFIVVPGTAALSHRKLASAGTSLDSCGAQGNGKRNAFY